MINLIIFVSTYNKKTLLTRVRKVIYIFLQSYMMDMPVSPSEVFQK